MKSTPRKYIKLFIGVILLVALITQLKPTAQLERPGQVDLLEYWAAAKLINSAENPYDPIKIEQIQRAEPTTGKYLESPILMWNPPFVVPIINFLGRLTFEEGRIAWTAITFLSLFGAIFLIILGENLSINWKTLAALVSFFPIVSILQFGQISWILILGLALGVFFLRRHNALMAGISLSLCLIKPHLLYLTYLSFLISTFPSHRLRFMIGFLSGAAILAASAELLAPGVWNQWLVAFGQPPVYFKTPTIGSLLQNFFGSQYGWIVYIPALITLIILGLFRNKSSCLAIIKDPISITALSLATAPYGWIFDQVLLLPLVLVLTARKDVILPPLVIFFNIQGFSPWMPAQHDYWWYPISLFLLALIASKRDQTHLSKACPQ